MFVHIALVLNQNMRNGYFRSEIFTVIKQDHKIILKLCITYISLKIFAVKIYFEYYLTLFFGKRFAQLFSRVLMVPL